MRPHCLNNRCRLAYVLLAVATVAGTGCSSYSGPSEYEQQKTAKEKFVSSVAELGGTAEEKHYQQPGVDRTAWVINLSGAKISEETVTALLERVKTEYVAEADFSGSTLTNEQLVQLDAGQFGISLVKLNLSNTGVTDQGLNQVNGMTLMMELKLSGSGVTREAADRFKERVTRKRQTEMNEKARQFLGDMKIEL